MTIICKLKKNDGGFYNNIWMIAAQYLLAKKEGQSFYLDDGEWMFGHTHGWRDYFTSLSRISEAEGRVPPPYYSICHIFNNPYHQGNIGDHLFHQFTLQQYRDALKDIFVLQDSLKNRLQTTLQNLSLQVGEFDTIMIRRGDKMYGESYYISSETYLKPLLERGSKKIFVQTDDYNAYLEIKNLAEPHGVSVYTTCPQTKIGCFVFNYSPEVGSKTSNENDIYLQNIAKHPKQKNVSEYNSDEMKEHVEEMIVGLEICKLGRYLSTDYQSNVTRYLFVTHDHPEHVFSAEHFSPPFDIPVKCPYHGFIPA